MSIRSLQGIRDSLDVGEEVGDYAETADVVELVQEVPETNLRRRAALGIPVPHHLLEDAAWALDQGGGIDAGQKPGPVSGVCDSIS